MIEINREHIEKFKEIENNFLPKTRVPLQDNWKSWTNNRIWLHLVTQVIVVGGSAPAEKFNNSTELKNRLSYEKLIEMEDQQSLKKEINEVLRVVGTRYASSDISKCRKTKALVHNLKVLKSFRNGPEGLLKRLSELKSLNADKRKIKYLMKILHFIQSKSARDFLMELGLVRNTVALDVRIQNIFRKIGVEFPKGLETNPKLYDEIEKDILLKVCKPLGLMGVELDRMLYQNYKKIMRIKL